MPRTNPITVTVHDKMQRNYCYKLVEPEGHNFDPTFKPELTTNRCSPSAFSVANT